MKKYFFGDKDKSLYVGSLKDKLIVTLVYKDIYYFIGLSPNTHSFKIFKTVSDGKSLFVDSESVKHYDIYDFDNDGTHWEGDTVGVPCGWGSIYNADNNCIYNGFYFFDNIYGFGTKYYDDCSQIEYCGELYKGKKHGYGKLFDKNGQEIYDGFWLNDRNDYELCMQFEKGANELPVFHSLIQDIVIQDDCFENISSFELIDYPELRNLTIGCNCFLECKEISICNCPSLEVIKIGNKNQKETPLRSSIDDLLDEISDSSSNNYNYNYPQKNHCSKSVYIQSISSFRIIIIDLEQLTTFECYDNIFSFCYKFILQSNNKNLVIIRYSSSKGIYC